MHAVQAKAQTSLSGWAVLGVVALMWGALVLVQSDWWLFAVGVPVVWAAIVDVRTGRIANELVLTVLVLIVVRSVHVVAAGEETAATLARDAATGVVASGAVGLFVVWLLRPRLIGGGDWKLLAVVGAALAIADPLAAALVGVIAVQLIVSLLRRRSVLPFAPAIAAGYGAGVTWAHWIGPV